MTELQMKYYEKGDLIREQYKREQKRWSDDKELTIEARKSRLNESRRKALDALKELQNEYNEAERQLLADLERNAFTCAIGSSKGLYLQTSQQADMADNQGRLRLAQNAVFIEEYDAVRAIARSAYLAKDRDTLLYLAQNTPSGVSKPINNLMSYASRDKIADNISATGIFSLPVEPRGSR